MNTNQDFINIIEDNINLINILNGLKKEIKIGILHDQFMRNIQNFICHLIFINEYQENLSHIDNYGIKPEKIEKLKEWGMIDSEKRITSLGTLFLERLKKFIEKFKLLPYNSFVLEIITSFNIKHRSPNILNKYFGTAHPDEIIYILFNILKEKNNSRYLELKSYIFQLIKNTNINLFEKIEENDEFYLIFFQRIFYGNIENNTLLRINSLVGTDGFKSYINILYKEYNILTKKIEEEETFKVFLKENYGDVFNIIKRVEYQEEIYSQHFVDIKALLFLELRNN